MSIKSDAGVRQLKNGFWAYRFSISVGGRKIEQRGSTDLDGNVLRTKGEAIKARKKAIRLAQLAPLLPSKNTEPVKKTVRQVFNEYCEKGRSDRAYNTILKQDSIWKNHLDEAFGDKNIGNITTAEVVDYLGNLYYEDEYSYPNANQQVKNSRIHSMVKGEAMPHLFIFTYWIKYKTVPQKFTVPGFRLTSQ